MFSLSSRDQSQESGLRQALLPTGPTRWPYVNLGSRESRSWKNSVFQVWLYSSFLSRILLLPGHGVLNSLRVQHSVAFPTPPERCDTRLGGFFPVTCASSTCYTAPLKGDTLKERWCPFAIKINVTHWLNSLWSHCSLAAQNKINGFDF